MRPASHWPNPVTGWHIQGKATVWKDKSSQTACTTFVFPYQLDNQITSDEFPTNRKEHQMPRSPTVQSFFYKDQEKKVRLDVLEILKILAIKCS